MKEELKPCPFCGGKVNITVGDDEGDIHSSDYENDPWSGLTFIPVHDTDDNPKCPIAPYKGEIIGTLLYESREELIETWNKRS